MGIKVFNADFYPRSPCGERPYCFPFEQIIDLISIHALLAESDRLWTILYSCPGNFYPRSPCGERPVRPAGDQPSTPDFYPRSPCGERLFNASCSKPIHAFLSTLSLRRATRLWTILYSCPGNFYPRSPCGERLVHVYELVWGVSISIHALLAESD